MNIVFLVTAKKAEMLDFVLRWFAVRVARTYRSIEEIGASIPDLPVAIGLMADKVNGVVSVIRAATKSEIVHVHVGARKIRKANGADSYYHVPDKVSVFFTVMGLEEIWSKMKNKGKDGGRNTIHVPK